MMEVAKANDITVREVTSIAQPGVAMLRTVVRVDKRYPARLRTPVWSYICLDHPILLQAVRPSSEMFFHTRSRRLGKLSLKSGLLPVKLNSGSDRRELDRARFLIASLSRNWRGGNPFHLHVICLNNEIVKIEQGVAPDVSRYSNLSVRFHRESDFFEEDSPFYQCIGTYKQQLIKIFVPPRLDLGAFFTFDADIVCIEPFDEGTFVRGDRLISAWEPRFIHSWWENSMGGARAWTDLQAPGLGVTPNALHSDICGLIEKYFSLRGLNAVAELARLTTHHPYLRTYEHEHGFALVWSEYSLYNIIGEWFGALERYHLSAAETKQTGVHIQSIRSVWGKDSPERLTLYKDHPGHFVIVQSWSGIPIEEVALRLEIPLG